jgi:hypothetical protein
MAETALKFTTELQVGNSSSRTCRRQLTRMKDIIEEQESQFDRPEPFASIYDLSDDYSVVDIIDAIQILCELDSEVEDSCPEHRDQSSWLAMQLGLGLGFYLPRFPPRYKANSRMVAV